VNDYYAHVNLPEPVRRHSRGSSMRAAILIDACKARNATDTCGPTLRIAAIVFARPFAEQEIP